MIKIKKEGLILYQPMTHICNMRLSASWCHIWECS